MKNIPGDIRWIGFDLDDTLHYFKKSSGKAANAVFSYFSENFNLNIRDLRASYLNILKENQRNHFVEGKTSRAYRSDRFQKMLSINSINSSKYVNIALDIYDEVLASNLLLKKGVKETLEAVKKAGFQTVVISEGPHDAQELTLKRLDIFEYIDLLITSGKEKLSKTDGLFCRALRKINCRPYEFIYVGDSMERDIIPAQSVGIHVLLLSNNVQLAIDVPVITQFEELTNLYSSRLGFRGKFKIKDLLYN